MIRRRTSSATATAAVLCGLLAAGSAQALTVTTRNCVKKARTDFRSCLTITRSLCRNAFEASFVNCFGPGAPCARGCQDQQAFCQTQPSTDQVVCQQACTATLRTALDGCQGAPDAQTCAANARLDQLRCNQACALAAAPALQACSQAFNSCLESCASQR
jgi:hypothetical protein